MRNLVIAKPTEDELATIGSIDGKSPDMAAAHRAVVLRNSWRRADTSWRQWLEQLNEAMKDRIWERYPQGSPAGSLPDLLKCLEIDPDSALSRNKFEERALLTHQEAGKLGGRGNKASDNCNWLSERGNGEEYLTARLKRDDPVRFRKFEMGEYRSVRAAAIEAGIVNPALRYSLPGDPVAAARYLAQRVDAAWWAEFDRARHES